MRPWPKTCACGRSYAAEEWLELPGCGRQDDGVDILDLRNCSCGSTIAVLVSDLPNDDRLDFATKRAEKIARLTEGARGAIHLAKRYEREDFFARRAWRDDPRIKGCLAQVAAYRKAIHAQRWMQFCNDDAVIEVCLCDELCAAE